jgi:hypothetical protein
MIEPTLLAPKLLRRATAAKMLGTSVSMMKRLEAWGRLHPVKLGLRCVFYTPEEIEALAQPTRKQSKQRRRSK